ncbi:MAG: hypothetical protein ACI4UG_03885, partial [Candidatus Onthovivens sp.]
NPMMKANNPIQKLGLAFGFPSIDPGFAGWILTACTLIYVLIFVCAFIYELRLAKYYDNKVFTKKWVGIYIATFFITFILCFGIGLIAQYPYNKEYMINSLTFLGESLLIGLILFLILGLIVSGILMLYINFKHIDEPFRFFGNKTKELEEKEKEEEEKEEKEIDDQGNLASSFGEPQVDEHGNPIFANGNGINGSNAGNLNGEISDATLKDKERVFPGLSGIDVINQANIYNEFEDNITLKDLTNNFRNYLAKEEKLYFDVATIRAFIAGLAASRLIILEGLSGTGKSSLARYFSEFIGESSYFEAVQATWRDRTSLLGYYNDFSKTYNETEFLKRLYEATYKENDINIMVLDEINISRVEYYFADFLSVLEYPTDKWILKIMQLPFDFDAPSHLENGKIKISKNTWFIGTANKDDSTYTITDKVYDRAITINFDNRNEEFVVEEETPKVLISYNKLTELFNEAINKEDNKLSKNDLEKFKKLTDFTYDTFDLTFGNRIMHQIEILTPVYVECGGSKEEALDFMFSRKVVGKLQGRFEDYIKQGLIDLRSLIEKTYGKEAFKLTKHEIFKLLRKL